MMSELKDWMCIRTFVPEASVDVITSALDELGEYFEDERRPLGNLSHYGSVRYTSSTEEHFIVRDGADPACQDPPPCVCIETWCSPGIEEAVVKALRACHPYQYPVIEVSEVRLATEKATHGSSANAGGYLILPPNQQLAAPDKWPVVGERKPRQSDEPWTVTVKGLVAEPLTWTFEELHDGFDRDHEQTVNIHCVTRWSKLRVRFGGVPLRVLLDQSGVLPRAKFVNFIARSDRNHSTSLPLKDALDLDALIAFTCEGKPLEEAHGGPVRMVVPGRYFYKSIKWLETIELLEVDKLGYWEAEAGYHNTADPWREQRYAVPNLNRREVLELFKTKDFSGKDLRSIEADHQQLAGLNARGAALRDAHFRNANLEGACFDGANLSNAHLEGANLRNATFRRLDDRIADLEGADFCGADLRGAVFESASLFGATFCSEPDHDNPSGPAIIDNTTRIDDKSIQTLAATPAQQEFVRQAILPR